MSKDIFECEVPKGKGVMGIIGATGDTKIFWNKKNKDEIENVKRTFEELVGKKKFAAFSLSKMGRKSKKVTEFDPNLQKLILIPPIAGGQEGALTTQECAPSLLKAVKINEEAEIKAMTLLKKKIGEAKFIKFAAIGYIEIKGKYGTYKLGLGNVELHRFDKIGKKTRPLIYGLCVDISPKIHNIPKGDRILSLYLSITENEEEFIKTANFRFVTTNDEFRERNETQT